MANKKIEKRHELWCQHGVQLHPRRMRNVISGPESPFYPHGDVTRDVTGDTIMYNW